MVGRFLFGDDVFVSYSRQDAVKYAEGLAGELSEKGYSCRIDQWESEPGKEMPASLLSALTRASMLVIVGTRGAAASTHVGKEIALFVRRKRPVIPVDFDSAIPGAVWYPVIQGLVLEREARADALETGLPSASVMSRIERSFTYRRRNERIQRVFRLTMAGIVLGLALLGVVSYRANKVQGEFQQVSDTLKGVETRLTSTTHDLDGKARELEKAQGDIEQAEQDLVSTRQSVRIAEQEAQRQGRISRSRALSSTADVLLSQQAAFLPRSTLLAIEAVRRYPTLEADQALRGALALLPMPWMRVASDAPIAALTFSPDGRLLVAAGANGINVHDAASGQLRHRLTPGGRFSSIAFAPDGARVMAVASNQIHLWKLADGSHQRIETRGPVQDLDVSPDGRFLVVADQTPDAGVFRLDGLKGVTKLAHAQKLQNDPVRRVAYDPAGRFVATGWRSSVMIWNTTEWTLLRTIQCNGGVRELAVSPDGRWLAVTTALGLQMLDLQAADAVPVTVHPRVMEAIAFHPNGKLIASGIDGTARIWEIETTQQLTAVTFEGRLADLSFSPDGRFLGTRTVDGVATLWNVRSGQPELHLAQLSGLSGMAFQPKGSLIATAARGDPTAILWRPESGRSVATIPGSSRPLYSDDGQYLAALGGVIKLSEKRFASAPTGSRLITGNGQRVAVDNGDAAEIRTLVDGQPVFRLDHVEPIDWKGLTEREVSPQEMRGRRMLIDNARKGSVRTLALSHDGRFALTARIDERLRLWDVERKTVIAAAPFDLGGTGDYPVRAVFSRNSAALAILHDRRIEIWHPLDAGRREAIESGDIIEFALDPRGAHLAARVPGPGVRIYSIGSTLQEVAMQASPGVLDAVLFGRSEQFSPREETGATGGGGGSWRTDPVAAATAAFRPGARLMARVTNERVEIVDLPAQHVRRTFPHETAIASAALSADGRYLATSSGGGVRVWDAVRGSELSRIEDGGGEPAFSKDGRLLATGAADGVRLWLWQPDDLVEEACARVTRNMTCSEWGQYIEDRRYGATCKALPVERCS